MKALRAIVPLGSSVALGLALLPSRASAQLVDAVRARNVELLDSVVFVLGVVILGALCVYWGRRIFLEK